MMNQDLMLDEKLFGRLDFDPNELKARYETERDRRVRPEGKVSIRRHGCH